MKQNINTFVSNKGFKIEDTGRKNGIIERKTQSERSE